MAALRKFITYRNLDRPYTRKSKFKKKNYVRAVPPHKIVKFNMGNIKKNEWKYKISLKSKETVQIRHNAIEATRLVINRRLSKLGIQNYLFKINLYPHQILRENKMLTGAGSDRMQTGMKHSFGKPIGTAAIVKKGRALMTTYTDTNIKIIEAAMKKAAPRLPCKIQIETEELESKA